MVNRKKSQFEPIEHAELVKDTRQVVLYRLVTESELKRKQGPHRPRRVPVGLNSEPLRSASAGRMKGKIFRPERIDLYSDAHG